MKIKLFLLAAIAALTTMVGCGNDNNESGPTPPDPALPEGYEITFGASTFSSQEITITPLSTEAEESLYVVYVATEAMFQEYGSAEAYATADLAAWIAAYPTASMEEIVYAMTNNGQNKGSMTTKVTGLRADCRYYAMVVGIDLEGSFTTQGTEELFTSGSKPEVVPVDCDFTWEVVRQGSIFIDVEVTPTNTEVPYVAFWLSQEEYQNVGGTPEGLQTNLEAYMEYLTENAGYESVIDLMAILQNKGEQTLQLQGLEPETSYILFLCGMDAYARPTTEVQVLTSNTIAYVASDATLTPAARVYDGTSASSMSPTMFPPETYSGNYFVRVKPILNDKAVAWYLLPTQTDYTKDTDSELLVRVSQQGNGPITASNIDVVTPNTTEGTFYLYMYPVNEEGEPGNIAKMSIQIDADSLWDINTIFDEDYTQGAAPSVTVHFSSAEKMMGASAKVNAIRIRRM